MGGVREGVELWELRLVRRKSLSRFFFSVWLARYFYRVGRI